MKKDNPLRKGQWLFNKLRTYQLNEDTVVPASMAAFALSGVGYFDATLATLLLLSGITLIPLRSGNIEVIPSKDPFS